MDKKINRKSASKWDQSGERALIEVWGGKMVQLRGCRKNSHILSEMASELEASGYKYTPEELKTKMHNMTNRYRKEKMKIGSTGGSPSEWDLYKEMEMLLAPFKSYHSEGLVADSIKDMYSDIQEILTPSSASATDISPDSPSTSFSTAPSLSPSPLPSSSKLRTSEKKKKNDNIDKLIKSVEKTVENIKSTSEKVVAIEEEKKEIFKKFAEKEAEVQDALLEFLKNN